MAMDGTSITLTGAVNGRPEVTREARASSRALLVRGEALREAPNGAANAWNIAALAAPFLSPALPLSGPIAGSDSIPRAAPIARSDPIARSGPTARSGPSGLG
jgi:hypothetical protein